MTKIDKPTSRYHLYTYSNDNTHYRKFVDSYEKNYILYASYQFYSEMSISGAPSGGFCELKKRSNDYKLDLLSIPYR